MKRILFFLLAMLLAGTVGCAGCGGGGPLLDHEPTLAELKSALKDAYVDLNKTEELSDSMVARLVAPKLPWASLSKVEREHQMSRTVMPVMLTLFQSFGRSLSEDDFDRTRNDKFRQGFNPSANGTFNCFTCHGESFPSGNTNNFDFARPTHLYPLDPKNLPTVENPGNSSARMVQFMTYTVTPAMRILLGRPDANCFTCHQVKK